MSEEQITRRLRVDISELEVALDDASWERSYYLDLETGKIVMITNEIHQQLEEIYEEAASEETANEEVDITPILDRLSVPEWKKEALREANQVDMGYGMRYISVPHAKPSEGYSDLEDFILTVKSERLQDRLWQAIDGKRPFRRFKDVLAGYPKERERWFRFKDGRIRERVLEWLEGEGIEPVSD